MLPYALALLAQVAAPGDGTSRSAPPVLEFPEAGIEEGYMTFTNEEILQCFEPVVNRILELVRNQIIAIQAQNRTLQNILVVGGFGASEYLFQQIKLHVPPQFQSKVVRPMDSVAAIVKGAVTAGITERIVTHRVARRHYLMATLQPFKEGHHSACSPRLTPSANGSAAGLCLPRVSIIRTPLMPLTQARRRATYSRFKVSDTDVESRHNPYNVPAAERMLIHTMTSSPRREQALS